MGIPHLKTTNAEMYTLYKFIGHDLNIHISLRQHCTTIVGGCV